MAATAQLKALLGMDTAEFQKKMDGAKSKTKDFQTQMGSVGKSITQAFSVVAVANFAKTMADQVGVIKDTADNLMITTDALQALTFEAKQNGVASEQLVQVLGKIKNAQGEVIAQDKMRTQALQTLNIKSEEFVGLSVDKALERLGKAYSDANGSAEAFNAVSAIIGERVGPRLMATLEKIGTVGMKAIEDGARSAGQVLDEDLISRADKAADEMTAMWDRIKNGGLIAIDYLRQGFEDLFMVIGIGWEKIRGRMSGTSIGDEIQKQKNQREEEKRRTTEDAKKKESEKKAAQEKSDIIAFQRNKQKAEDEKAAKEQEKIDSETAKKAQQEYEKQSRKNEAIDEKDALRQKKLTQAEQDKADIIAEAEQDKADILDPQRKMNGIASGAINADAMQRMGGQVGAAAVNLGPQEKALRIQEEMKNLTKETNKKLDDISKVIGGLQP
jgi:hypothetical protein